MRHGCGRIIGILVLVLLSWRTFAQGVSIVNAFPNLSFTYPIFFTSAEDGTHRLFVVQQNGLIKVFQNDSATANAKTFLNISAKISSSSGEEGLLGLAFHPHFSSNGYFYVNYTAPNPLHTVVERYSVRQDDQDRADSLSGFTIIEIDQPFANHNGGMLAFGPDGYLYMGMGDGGDANDPNGNGQNKAVLLGKMLRIDVDDTTATTHYVIPQDNPFAGNSSGWREEIWALGMRNPWRWSFDPPTGTLWCGDVGQGAREEVDIIKKGMNYGWNIMEGTICRPGGGACDTTGLTPPIKEYPHTNGNIAITGGYVYRGYRQPFLEDAYVYADYGTGRIWMLRYENDSLLADSLLLRAPFPISSFGTDENGELYIVGYEGSAGIYRFAGNPLPVSVKDERRQPENFRLDQNFPNPFNPSTSIGYRLSGPGRARLVIYDLLGRAVTVLVDGWEAAGEHHARWDASGFASGVYVCRLTGSQGTLVVKMILLR
jgi:glucose/arabinose dehydrogenase